MLLCNVTPVMLFQNPLMLENVDLVTWGQPISSGVTWVKPIFFQYFLNILAFVEVVLYFYKVSN